MPNYCYFRLMAVAKTEAAIKELLCIMKNKDDRGRFLPRIFSADANEIVKCDDNFCCVIEGDCAWSIHSCFHPEGYYKDYEDALFTKKFKDKKHRNIILLCKELGIDVEIWGKEYDMGFQEHYIVHTDGAISCDCRNWDPGYDDEGEQNEELETGGFPEWGDFSINS